MKEAYFTYLVPNLIYSLVVREESTLIELEELKVHALSYKRIIVLEISLIKYQCIVVRRVRADLKKYIIKF